MFLESQKLLSERRALVGLYGVDTLDTCVCPAGKDCTSPGKHPVSSGWCNAASQILTDLELAELLDHPEPRNVGTLTGEPSGFFVLDVDVKSGGVESLERLERDNSPLPWTRKHATGSGGFHLLFRMPEGQPISNSNRALRDAGYIGIDIRGTGGYIVGPGSVSSKGRYRVQVDAAVAAAPQWLLDLLLTPQGFHGPAPDRASCAEYESFPADVQRHVDAYVEAGVQRELQRFVDEYSEENWDDRTNEIAFTLFVLANSPWNNLDPGDVAERIEGAVWSDEGFPHSRAVKCINSAWNAVERRDLIRDLPPAIEEKVPQNPTGPELDAAVEEILSQFLSTADLDSIADLVPLVDGYLYRDSLGLLWGPSESLKTFVALHLAGCVSAGREWYGRTVTSGVVVYIVAEGAAGIRKRVRAWEEYHGTRMDNVLFLPLPVQMGDKTRWAALTQACVLKGADLVIIDTLARSTVGTEENSNKEMGIVIEQAENLRRATGACVLPIHHTGYDESHARGASSLRGALQSSIKVTRKGDNARNSVVTVSVDKQKDDEKLPSLLLRLEVIDWGETRILPSGEEKRVTSIVLTTAQGNVEPGSLQDLTQPRGMAHALSQVPEIAEKLAEGKEVGRVILERHISESEMPNTRSKVDKARDILNSEYREK